MKNNVKPPFYFSIFPLTSYRKSSASGEQSLFLKSILNGDARPYRRTPVFHLVNPYGINMKNDPECKYSPVPEDTGQNENGWYQNYE